MTKWLSEAEHDLLESHKNSLPTSEQHSDTVPWLLCLTAEREQKNVLEEI